MEAERDYSRMHEYIVGKMPAQERREFEERLAREPGLVRELEDSLRLREGLQQLRDQGHALQSTPGRTLLRIWSPLLAAAVVVGVALFLRTQFTAVHAPSILSASLPPGSGSAGRPVAELFTFIATRGALDLQLPDSGEIELRAAPQLHETNLRYRMTLVRQEGGLVGTLPDLATGTDGYVHAFVDAATLTPGRYELHLEVQGPPADPDVFPFRLRRGAP
jgi:hypothetical protein